MTVIVSRLEKASDSGRWVRFGRIETGRLRTGPGHNGCKTDRGWNLGETMQGWVLMAVVDTGRGCCTMLLCPLQYSEARIPSLAWTAPKRAFGWDAGARMAHEIRTALRLIGCRLYSMTVQAFNWCVASVSGGPLWGHTNLHDEHTRHTHSVEPL